MKMKAAILIPAVAFLAGGCAIAPQPADDNVKMVKIWKTGSNMPVMVPYMGPEHVRYIEASRSGRESIDKIVSPPIPLNSN